MSLTLYVAHALVFNLVVDWLGWVEPAGLDTALTFAAVYWVVAIAAAVVVAPPPRHRPRRVAVPSASAADTMGPLSEAQPRVVP